MGNQNKTVIVLTGPPASGKSTITDMIREMAVPCKDTGDAIRDEAERRYEDPDEDDVWDVAESIREEIGPEGPTAVAEEWIHDQDSDLICISSTREQAEVEWLRDEIGDVLTIRIDAPQLEREHRYVESKIENVDPGISKSKVENLREELREREERESPYPNHDVMIWNDNDTQFLSIQMRIKHTINALRGS